jgi:phosphotriesterase-related protein
VPTSLDRRTFLTQSALALAAGAASFQCGVSSEAADAAGQVMTVTGEVLAKDLGRTLPHEHVTTDFLGAERLPAPRYDRDAAFAEIRPHFDYLARTGVRTLVECTPAHIGRDVILLRRLSDATGVRVVTNTGYYGAVENKYLPRHAHTESVEQLAERWLAEWRDGIEGTGIRPGFVKLGTGSGKLPALHVRLLRAACRVHRESGLTLAMHTGDGEAARDEVRVLREEGVDPAALVWVHAQNDPGPIQVELARLGVWISLDGYSLATRNPERYLNLLLEHRKAGTLGRVLISHDDGWAVEGEEAAGSKLKLFGNGNPQPYRSWWDRGLPDLRQAGFQQDELTRLVESHPAEAFTRRRRML